MTQFMLQEHVVVGELKGDEVFQLCNNPLDWIDFWKNELTKIDPGFTGDKYCPWDPPTWSMGK